MDDKLSEAWEEEEKREEGAVRGEAGEGEDLQEVTSREERRLVCHSVR